VTRLEELLRRSPPLMDALRAARAVDAPDWLITAGAIRDLVWDSLHDREPAPARDIDLGFFDPDDLSPGNDARVEAALRARADLPWEATNQAAVHLWYGRDVAPLRSTADGVATFPEIATCVGARLLPDDGILVVAPHGLDDLFGLVCRHNPARVDHDFYRRRVAEKRWRQRWPKLRILD